MTLKTSGAVDGAATPGVDISATNLTITAANGIGSTNQLDLSNVATSKNGY